MRAPPAPRRFRFWCAVWACVLGFGFRLRPASPWGGVGTCVCSCARAAWSPCTSWLGVLCGGACLCVRLACSPPFLAGACCVGVRAGPGSRLCLALLGWVVGVCFSFFFFFSLCGVGRWLSLLGLVVPVPPSPLFRAGLMALFFFFFPCGVCLRVVGVPFPGGPLFLAWCCRFWLGGPPVPLWGSCLRCLLGGGVWPPLVVLAGGVGGCGPFSRPPPSPPVLFFFFLGGVRLFLPLPSLGWRTHWPAFSVVFRVAVGGCVLFGPVPAPWVGWVMYTLGSAPLPAGLGPGSAGWAGAPGGFVWIWVRGLGLSVSFLHRGAGFNLLGGPPPLLPGARWPRV